jgi:hypothetical protein
MTKKYAIFNANNTLETRLVRGIHDVPKNAVEVDDETWIKITQETDGVWTLNADGSLSKASLPPTDRTARAANERAWRNGELARVAWLRDRHRDQLDSKLPISLSAAQFSEFLVYTQELRDWPAASEFPDASQRPKAPVWLAEQSQ